MMLTERSSRARSRSCTAAARSSLPPRIVRLMRSPWKSGTEAETSKLPVWSVCVW